MWQAGDRCGRYELVAPLGKGGAATVWSAVLHGPSGFRKEVALKLLHARPTEIDRESFREEARLGAMVCHPHVAATLELGEVDDTLFVAMELVRGPTVHQLRRAGPLTARAILEIGIQVCAGLAHLHRLSLGEHVGLVHRDIKPSNLLVDPHGMVKITDLGIAMAFGAQASVSGTPTYAAPEQVTGQPLDGRADLFALGATLYVLATRTRFIPRGGVASPGILAWRHGDPTVFPLVDATVPGLGDVLSVALQAEPEDRFADAPSMGAALAGLIGRLGAATGVRALLGQRFPHLVATDTASIGSSTVPLRGNLTRPADRFFGRDDVVASLVADLAGAARLVVVHGPGGMGKTRLALEVGHRMAPRMPGGVWFVDLSEAREIDVFCSTLARVLDVQLDASDPVAQLGQALRSRGRSLFVLDNLEQLADQVGDPIVALAAAAPDARLVCTTRIDPLMAGATIRRLAPLAEDEAVALFRDRASVTPGPEDAAHVRRIVAAADHLPLAIELCAARTRVLGVEDLADRASDRAAALALAARRRGTGPARHHSLHAVLDGSWELLSPEARDTLARCAVFEGGFTLAAAEAVVAGSAWVLDTLQELVDASLVAVDPERERFTMLRMVQEYAHQKLGEDREQAEARHRAFFAQYGSDDNLRALVAAAGTQLQADIAAELDNLEAAALRPAQPGHDADNAARAARAAWATLRRLGPFSRGERILRTVLPQASPTMQVDLLRDLCRAEQSLGRMAESLATQERAMATAERAGIDPYVIRTMGAVRGWILFRCHRVAEADEALQHHLALARDRDARSDMANTLDLLAAIRLATRRLDEVEPLASEALQLFEEVGWPYQAAITRSRLAGLRGMQGRVDEALDLYEQSLEVLEASGGHMMVARVMASMGSLLLAVGRAAEARRITHEALVINRRQGDGVGELKSLLRLALIDKSLGRREAAVQQFGEVLERATALGHVLYEAAAIVNLGGLCLELGDRAGARAHLEDAIVRGEAIAQRDLLAEARAGLGTLLLEDGDLDGAEAVLTAALADAEASRYRRAQARIRASQAELAVRRGAIDAARARLESAAAILADTSELTDLADLLARRVALERAHGTEATTARARAALDDLVAEVEVEPGSRLAEILDTVDEG